MHNFQNNVLNLCSGIVFDKCKKNKDFSMARENILMMLCLKPFDRIYINIPNEQQFNPFPNTKF